MVVHQIVNSVFNSCTYILHIEGCDKAIIIDSGDIQPIVDYLKYHKLQLVAIFLTHSHFDHIYGLPTLAKMYPNAAIYTSENGIAGLKDSRWNMSRYHEEADDIEFESPMVKSVADNDVISEAGIKMKVILTPGHDWSCVSYLCKNYLFTGDSYIPGIKVETRWRKSNKQLAQESENIIKRLENNGAQVYSGHYITT